MINSENSEKTRTNADKIRALPTETLAAIIRGCCRGCDCFNCPLERFGVETLGRTHDDKENS